MCALSVYQHSLWLSVMCAAAVALAASRRFVCCVSEWKRRPCTRNSTSSAFKYQLSISISWIMYWLNQIELNLLFLLNTRKPRNNHTKKHTHSLCTHDSYATTNVMEACVQPKILCSDEQIHLYLLRLLESPTTIDGDYAGLCNL